MTGVNKKHRCKANTSDRISIEYLEIKGRGKGGKTSVFKSWHMFVTDAFGSNIRSGYKVICCPFCAKMLEIPKEKSTIEKTVPV